MISLSYFWFVWLVLGLLAAGVYFGMGFELLWLSMKDMIKPEFYPKKPWWWRK